MPFRAFFNSWPLYINKKRSVFSIYANIIKKFKLFSIIFNYFFILVVFLGVFITLTISKLTANTGSTHNTNIVISILLTIVNIISPILFFLFCEKKPNAFSKKDDYSDGKNSNYCDPATFFDFVSSFLILFILFVLSPHLKKIWWREDWVSQPPAPSVKNCRTAFRLGLAPKVGVQTSKMYPSLSDCLTAPSGSVPRCLLRWTTVHCGGCHATWKYQKQAGWLVRGRNPMGSEILEECGSFLSIPCG